MPGVEVGREPGSGRFSSSPSPAWAVDPGGGLFELREHSNAQKIVLCKTVLLSRGNSAVFHSTVFVSLAMWFLKPAGSSPIVEMGKVDDSGLDRGGESGRGDQHKGVILMNLAVFNSRSLQCLLHSISS